MDRIIFIFVLFGLLACSQNHITTTLVVDDEHFQVTRAEGKEPLVYIVPSGTTEIMLDSKNYKFVIPSSQSGKSPNSLLVMFTDGRMYEVANNSGAFCISNSTAIPIGTTARFSEIKYGDTVVIMIGVKGKNDETGKEKFTAFWHSRIETR